MFIVLSVLFALLGAGIIFVFLLGGMTHEKVYRMCGSQRSYLAWIPIANYYELAVITRDEEDKNSFFGMNIDNKIFKYWPAALGLCNIIPFVGWIATLVVMIACLGGCYGRLYAMVENKQLSETKGIGYLTGFIPIIAIFKFVKYLDDEPTSQYTNAKYNSNPQARPQKQTRQTRQTQMQSFDNQSDNYSGFENQTDGFSSQYDDFNGGFDNQNDGFGDFDNSNDNFGGFDNQASDGFGGFDAPQNGMSDRPQPQRQPQVRPQQRPQQARPQVRPQQARPQVRPQQRPQNSDFESFN